MPLSNEPGTSWGYSLAIDVFGELLARAADTALPDVIELFITGPLGMSDTAFEVRDRKRLAVPYVDGNPPHRMLDPEVVHLKDGSHCRFSPSRILHSDSFVSGGTGMAGTTTDFLRFLETMRQGGGGILARETVQTMMSNQIGALRINVEPTPSWGFGIGGTVLVDSDLAEVPQANSTWKWGGVYGHHWFVDPKNRLSLVSLSNTAAEGMMGSFVTELRNAVYDVG